MGGPDVDVSVVWWKPASDRRCEHSALVAWYVDQDVKMLLRSRLPLSNEKAEEPASVVARPASQLVPSAIHQSGVIERREIAQGFDGHHLVERAAPPCSLD